MTLPESLIIMTCVIAIIFIALCATLCAILIIELRNRKPNLAAYNQQNNDLDLPRKVPDPYKEGRECWQYLAGTIYCGPDAKKMAIKQMIAIQESQKKRGDNVE